MMILLEHINDFKDDFLKEFERLLSDKKYSNPTISKNKIISRNIDNEIVFDTVIEKWKKDGDIC